jgi:diguanylate cyclase (GGDEF)-like protein/PAS domain S-box-containing protein
MTPPIDASVSTILLIQMDPAVAAAIRSAVAAGTCGSFVFESVHELSAGLARLGRKGVAAVLLELKLPDSQGIGTFDQVFAAVPDVPIVILGGHDNEALAKEAVARGAQDYVPFRHLNDYSLPRALRHAIDRKVVEDALYAERERALVTLNSIGDAVLCTDVTGKVTYLNLVAEAMTGWGREEAIGRPLADVFRIIDGPTRKTARDPMEMAVEQNRTVGLTANCVLVRRDGFESAIEDSAAPIHDRGGRVIGAVIVFHDVSAARAMSLAMTHAAQHDIVTNLPNRLLLHDRILQAISLARRQRRPMAVIFLDLDHFKYVNDSLGHAIGDQLLQSVSLRLVASVRNSDTVSRQGGDEFVVLLSDLSHANDAVSIARKILGSFDAPHLVRGQLLHVNASIGISIYPDDGEDADALIQNADMAMYSAKESGRNTFKFFKSEMNQRSVQRQALEGRLRNALERQEFLLHYQPKVNLITGEITGVEALVRWSQPGQEMVLPGQFVPVAEECGLIVRIGNWVLREACQQARSWQIAGLPSVPTSVNVSAVELREPGFIAGVSKILQETGLSAQYLELELTEGVLMTDAASTVLALKELKAMGVHLAVDDFGTGYSSLSYLRQFPVDVLKIDQSFIREITANFDSSTLVGAIIEMGKSLKHVVIAEGIETPEQRAYLQSQHCAEGQGYLFGRPVAAAEFASMLRNGLAKRTAAEGSELVTPIPV